MLLLAAISREAGDAERPPDLFRRRVEFVFEHQMVRLRLIRQILICRVLIG